MIKNIEKRSEQSCEMCQSKENLQVYFIKQELEYGANLCKTCLDAVNFNIEEPQKFKLLEQAMWSEIPAIKILSYQILNFIKDQSFARELLEILYIEDELKNLAKTASSVKDSNGNILNNGDSVSIIKDLEVKGANFTAKRGTIVKNINLNGSEDQVEGKVNGVKIVLLSKFLKKI